MHRQEKIRFLIQTALVAALYAGLTVGLAPISYMAVQFRLSEVLTLLAFVNPAFAPGLVLGTFIANLFSPLGLVDVVFGTLATLLSVWFMTRSKTLWRASLWPTLFNGIIVGLELHFVFALPLLLTMAQVAVGEFVVVTLAGVPLFRQVLRHAPLSERLKSA